MTPKPVRVFGMDPGIGRFGWAAVEIRSGVPALLGAGRLSTPARQSEVTRLQSLYRRLVKLLREFAPDRVAIEKLYFSRNVSTAMAVGQARGIALLAAAESNIPVLEFSPTTIKSAVTGYGRAEKRQIRQMVKTIFRLRSLPTSDDLADAVAVAWCGTQSVNV